MKRILIVDDAATVRLYTRAHLEAEGFSVEEAENGVEALEMALCSAYDLLLVDVNMPKMDGYSLVKEIRTHPELRSTPILMLTTEGEAHDRDRSYAAGANLHMTKPVPPDVLQQTVKLVLGANP